MTSLLACACAGIIEALILLFGCGITAWLTKVYNKCKRPCCETKKFNMGKEFENRHLHL